MAVHTLAEGILAAGGSLAVEGILVEEDSLAAAAGDILQPIGIVAHHNAE